MPYETPNNDLKDRFARYRQIKINVPSSVAPWLARTAHI
jgi:hypothetical protein